MGQLLGFLGWRGPACTYPSIQAVEQRGVSARHLFVNEKSHPAVLYLLYKPHFFG